MLRSNVALSYIAMLSVVGFFLWVIRNFVRGLRQKDQLPQVAPLLSPSDKDGEKKTVNWPAHIFLDESDDIPIPGTIVSVSPSVAFLESSACLVTGQEITLYVDVGSDDQARLEAQVTWARVGRDGRNAAHLAFPSTGDRGVGLHTLADRSLLS